MDKALTLVNNGGAEMKFTNFLLVIVILMLLLIGGLMQDLRFHVQKLQLNVAVITEKIN